jgi:cytoplasmic FMR1 interacting protein
MMMQDNKSGEENIIYLPAVINLSTCPLSGGPANIESPCFAIDYDLCSVEDGDYKDRVAYQNSSFTEETKCLENLNELLVAGQQYISMLYTYRSCSAALPMVQNETSEQEKKDVYQKTFVVLRPETLKLKQFMDFHERAVLIVKNNMAFIAKNDSSKYVHSDHILNHLVKVVDMLILLDALKDMKACLQNDFSRYKRAFNSIKSELSDSEMLNEEIHKLQMFLSNPQQPHNLIMFHLKTDIQKVSNYDLVLTLMLNHCMDSIENGRYLLPSDFHSYYRVMPYLLYLLDSDEKKGGINVFKDSGKIKFKLERIQKLFKSFPIIPLYADMHIDLMFILKRCNHWEEETMAQNWQTAKPAKLVQRYQLIQSRQIFRNQYNEFTSTFTALLNEVQAYTQAKRIITPKMLTQVFNQVLAGLRLLSEWSSKIKEQAAFKYSKPKSDDEYKRAGGAGGKGHEYEKAVKYNYTPEELYALIDVIGMVKGLGGLMLNSELIHIPLVRRCIHDEVQIFLQQEVARPLRKAHKR